MESNNEHEIKIVITKPIRPRRKETLTWKIPQVDLSSQIGVIDLLYHKTASPNDLLAKQLLAHIRGKISSYRSQDIRKNKSPTEITATDVIRLLYESKCLCFYCHEPVQVLYEMIRESAQWTLDRIDNNYGHHANNLVISCLRCNLNRKRMSQERFYFSKNVIVEKESGNTDEKLI